MDELKRWKPSLQLSSPYPGIVQSFATQGQADSDPADKPHDMPPNEDDRSTVSQSLYDPVYALQALPECHIVAGESVKKLATEVTAAIVGTTKSLDSHPLQTGSLAIHALVPGMCKGQTEPQGQRRVYLVADTVQELLKKQYPEAFRRRQTTLADVDTTSLQTTAASSPPGFLLQILLLSTELAAVSLSECSNPSSFSAMLWPNPNLPAGLAMVDMIRTMPSSAYRKLLEAFSCWNCMPSPTDVVVDLGASPGGWTAALIHICQSKRIIAVDRSELDPELMSHPAVEFIKGDAFTFHLPKDERVDWMLSDVIAYPERVVELVDLWCSKHWARRMIITVKFKGNKPAWDALELAIQTAQSHGYDARAKHFFNNKNEVTLMLSERRAAMDDSGSDLKTVDGGSDGSVQATPVVRGAIYNVAWKP